MKRTTQHGFHRHVFLEAWRLTWQRPTLWLLAVFAGVAMSGAAVESIVGSFVRTNRMAHVLDATWWAEQSVWMGRAGGLIQDACRVDQRSLQLWMLAVVILGLIAGAFVLWCQTGLIAGLLEKQKPTLPDALHHRWEHVGTLFAANVLVRAAQTVLAISAGLPVVLYLVRPGFWETFGASIAMIAGLGLGSFTWIVALLTTIRAIHKEERVHAALAWAFRLSREKPLLLLETALLLAGAGLLALLGIAVTFILASLLLAVFWVALGSGTWLPGAAFVGAVGTVGFSLLLLSAWGALTTFRYAVWIRVYDRLSSHLVRRTTVAKTHRLFHPKHIR